MPAGSPSDARYLALRRAIGFTMQREARLLQDFVEHLERRGDDAPVAQVAVEWASASTESQHARRLSIVRGFLTMVRAAEPDVDVPGAWPRSLRRVLPARRHEAHTACTAHPAHPAARTRSHRTSPVVRSSVSPFRGRSRGRLRPAARAPRRAPGPATAGTGVRARHAGQERGSTFGRIRRGLGVVGLDDDDVPVRRAAV